MKNQKRGNEVKSIKNDGRFTSIITNLWYFTLIFMIDLARAVFTQQNLLATNDYTLRKKMVKKKLVYFIILGLSAIILVNYGIASPADPGHEAVEIGAGMFESGNYTFPDSLHIEKYFNVTNLLFVDPVTNRVGIGTTAPGTAKLNVTGTIDAWGMTTNGTLTCLQDGTNCPSGATGVDQWGWTNTTGFVYTTQSGDIVHIGGNVSMGDNLTVGGNVLYVDSSGGYVGIGGTSPTSQLSVTGDVNATGGLRAPTICVGNDCRTSWPVSDSGTDLINVAWMNETTLNDTYYRLIDDGTIFNATFALNVSLDQYQARNNWAEHDNYPSACSAGQVVAAIGDTLTCILDNSGNTTEEIQDAAGAMATSGDGVDFTYSDDANTLTPTFDCSDVASAYCSGEDLAVDASGTCAANNFCGGGHTHPTTEVTGVNAGTDLTADLEEEGVSCTDCIADDELDGGFGWTLDTDLNFDSNTLVVSQDDDRVGVGTAIPTHTFSVVGTMNVTRAAGSAGGIEVDGSGNVIIRLG